MSRYFPPTLGSPVSPRERHILAGLARGRTNAQIALDLQISPVTVKTHLKRISIRYGVGCRSGIVGVAYRRGDLAGLPPEHRERVRVSRAALAVLDGISRGLTYAQIAKERDRTEDTAKSVMCRLMRRMGARGRAHAVALAYQQGYLPLPEQQAQPAERAA